MLDEDGIRKHLELLCKCFISQKLHHTDFRAKSNHSLVHKGKLKGIFEIKFIFIYDNILILKNFIQSI